MNQEQKNACRVFGKVHDVNKKKKKIQKRTANERFALIS